MNSHAHFPQQSCGMKCYFLSCVFFKTHTHIQLLKQVFSDSFPSQSGRYPVAVVMITVPPADIDVNLEPNKTSVLLRNMVSSYYCYHNYTVDSTVCIQVIVARP